MATSQTEEAADNKPESVESGIVQESGGEKSEPKEPAAIETPADETVSKQNAEETQEYNNIEEKEVEEKTEAMPETTDQPKAEPVAKAEVAEDKDKPDIEAKQEAEEKAETKDEAKEKTEARSETTDQPKAEPKAKAEVAEDKDKPDIEAKQEAKEKAETKAEVKGEAETKPQTEEKTSAPTQEQESKKGKVWETIQKMTQSPAILPGESGKAAINDICVSSKVCAKDIMQKDVTWATSEESVEQALTKMQQRDSGYIMIGKDGILEGIVSKSDITGATSIYLRPIFAKWYGPLDDATLQIKLKWIMSRPVRTVKPETPLAIIIENICRFGGRCLPVVDEQGKVQGLVTVFDIFRTLLNTSDNVSAVGKTAEAPALVEH